LPRKAKILAPSVVKTVAATLRADSLACKDGQLIASEADLLARYGVSRPTLRQAAAIVVQEQLLKVKRGVNGGYVAVKPAGEAVAHMAAIYLHARGVDLGQILRAVEPIRAELARLAADNADSKVRAEIEQFLQRELHPSDDSYRGFLRSEREFGEILGRAGKNDVLSLYLNILYDLAATVKPQYDVYIGQPERVAEYRKVRAGIAKAVLEGDSEIAMLAARRGSALVARWMVADERAQRAKTQIAASGSRDKGPGNRGRKSPKSDKNGRYIT
jgi:GntR family transcriptional regulator, transcriptional repressor for pyruvate dehydrogenase complex